VVLRIAVGLVLLRAATAKLTARTEFRRTVAGLGIPGRIAGFAASVFVVAEGGLALWVLSGQAAAGAAIGCLLFLAGLVLVSCYALVTGRNVSCSCFGASDRPLGSQTLLLSGPLLAAQAAYLMIGLSAGAFPAVRPAELPVALALALLLIAFASGLTVGPAFVRIVRHRRRLASAMAAEGGAARSAP
jgi:hypothetical protein